MSAPDEWTTERPTRTPWAWVRAAVLFVFVAINVYQAIPVPRMKAGWGDKATSQRGVAPYVDALATVGVSVTREQLAGTVEDVARGYARYRERIIDPMRPFWKITVSHQGWGLFTYPDTTPHRLEVAFERDDGSWEPAYHPGDWWNARWRHDFLRFRRVRALLAPRSRPPSTYDRVVDHIAELAFADRPDIERVRVRFVKTHTPPPGRPMTFQPMVVHERLRTRDDVERHRATRARRAEQRRKKAAASRGPS